MKIIILNGAPNTGKDTIADYLVENYSTDFRPVEKKMFKEKLIEAAIRTSGVDEKLWHRHYERDLKEEPWDKLKINGTSVSPRDYLIHMSENVMKPLFGEAVFGLSVANSLTDDSATYIFSDGGFVEEMLPLIKKVGEDNFYLVRLNRENCDFNGDSRKHVYLPIDNQIDLDNDSTIEDIAEEIWAWSTSGI